MDGGTSAMGVVQISLLKVDILKYIQVFRHTAHVGGGHPNLGPGGHPE